MSDRSDRKCRPRTKHKAFFMEASFLAQLVIKLRKSKVKYVQRLRTALKLSGCRTFQRVLKNFTTIAAIFTLMQFREIKKSKMNRRFTQSEKIMALSLYRKGPRAYKCLHKWFVLPSPITLNRVIAKAALKPGINENIFNQLKKITRKLKKKDRLCTLLFNEIALKPHFEYSKKKDVISGFVNNGRNIQPQIADHALVFMIRGAFRNYKQPISYTFCKGSTGEEELAQQITEAIRKVNNSGLKVVATVCDQRASNLAALNLLIEQTKAAYLRKGKEYTKHVFEIDGQEVVPLYDPPNLIKGIRNHLISKNLKCVMDNEVIIAKWQHLIMFLKENPSYKGVQLVTNLSEDHIDPRKINRQKVEFATQLFSRSYGVRLDWLASIGILPDECQDTARVLLFFDELFDSVNGSSKSASQDLEKIYLRPLTPCSKHLKLWNKAKKVLATMRFINKKGQEVAHPSIECWIKTIDNIEYLQKIIFHAHRIQSIWLRNFNQDPLENFFGGIRGCGYHNIKPSCAGFEVAFASILINNLRGSHSPESNCEEDFCRAFKSFRKLLLSNHSVANKEQNKIEIDSEDRNSNVLVDVKLKLQDPRRSAPLNYATGYVLKRSKKYIFKNCRRCKDCLYDGQNKNDYNLSNREFKKGTSSPSYPSRDLVEMLSTIQDVTYNILLQKSTKIDIKSYIKTALNDVIDTNFIKCTKHKVNLIEYVLDLSVRFYICNWCRDCNKLLNGTKTDYDVNNVIQKSCVQYHLQQRKNKSTINC